MEENKASSPDTPGPPGGEDYVDEPKKSVSPAKGPKSPPERERRREKSRSRERKARRSRSPSSSPEYRGRIDRGARRNNNNRFNNRRSPDRGFRGNRFQGKDRSRDRNFNNNNNNNNRRSRSRSRDNRRRMNNRRNQSITPPPAPTNIMYQQPVIYNDPSYANYAGQNQQQFMQQGFGYDYPQQVMYPPPAPPAPFISGNQMNLPIPPGDDFAPQQQQWCPPPTMMMNVPPPTIPEHQEIDDDKNNRDIADPRLMTKQATAAAPDLTAAVAQEMKTQREALRKQRDEYHVRAASLRKEIKVLKQKKADLIGSNSSGPVSPKTGQFCKENDKLQAQISNKLSTIMNVIDMLNGIIGEEDEKSKKHEKTPKKGSKKSRHKSKSPKSNNSSPERLKTEVLLSIKNKQKNREAAGEEKPKVNFTFYDPELHWCQTCNSFPKTARDYLAHLHSKEHEDKMAEKQAKNPEKKSALDSPWREEFTVGADLAPTYKDAPTKRTPIKGLQFFVPSSAWFCKLCSIWMGDLHCASVHLKTETHAEKFNKHAAENPNFEMEWMTKRSHAYELFRENEEKAIAHLTAFNQIPLTIQSNPAVVVKAEVESKRKKEDKKIKKKKTKKDDRKDRKKKRRTKKKKHGSSSSSSDSDDSDDSDDSSSSSQEEKKDDKVDTKNSIRVAMRNYLDLKQKKEEKVVEPAGKWTVVSSNAKPKPIPPPAPAFSESSIKEKKRDELIIQQWTPAEPIISTDERKLLEKLKGRLKTNQLRPEEKKEDVRISVDRKRSVSRDRSRDHSRSHSRGYRNDRDRNYRRRNSRSRSSSRGYSRRSRSRSRSNNRYRSYRRSRSRSRGRRVEKAIVRFPPEPQLPPLREERKSKPYSSRKEEKKTDKLSGSKKLPFIGKMPVFKKMESDSKKSESEMTDIPEVEESVADQQEETVEPVEGMQECFDDEMDLMPDPLQFNAMFGAPPPPPIHEDKNQEILPPGIDDAESEFIPKPISDAPVPRKGPLPKDFQDTLNLLFDGDTPKPIQLPEPKPEPVVIIEAPPPIDHDQPTFVNMSDEELSQHYGGQYSNHANQQFFNPVDAPPLPADPKKAPEVQAKEEIVQSAKETPKAIVEQKKLNGKDEKPNPNRYEMDASDLAMLGIDVDDFLY